MMQRLPLIAALFMAGIICNCLRQLLNWSVTVTHDVLVILSSLYLGMTAMLVVYEIIVYRRTGRGSGGHNEA
ncbi:hypothetical protein [Pantoea ananatis]|uniref:hypothetical protein n=1 Tax=Pantoea ananas TaxID=553 RepID=UPI001FF0CAD3|nr:hypothetical protein [Pantoea ananatis]